MSQDIFVFIEHLRGSVADITYMNLAQARDLVSSTGGRVVGVLLGHAAESLSQDLAADEILYLDHPSLAEYTWDAYLTTLAAVVKERAPHLVLFGDTSIGAEAASGLAARLNVPMVGFCRRLTANGGIRFLSQICGGKLLAEGALPEGTVVVALLPGAFKVDDGRSPTPPPVTRLAPPPVDVSRVTIRQFIEPESGDVDITREPILVAVGRGIQREDNLPLAQELAEALGGVVVASRPVIDQKWLPTTRLVGKSGKVVKPKVYLALGISGAPEHTEAITGSEMIIAVNTDPAAPIFSLAKYGAQVDILDLLPVLTDKVRQSQ